MYGSETWPGETSTGAFSLEMTGALALGNEARRAVTPQLRRRVEGAVLGGLQSLETLGTVVRMHLLAERQHIAEGELEEWPAV
jgi:hypothetical protein